MQQAVPPVAGARNDHDILADVAERLGVRSAFTEDRSEMEWVAELFAGLRRSAIAVGVELPEFEEFWRRGHIEIPPPTEPYQMFGAFRADPQGNALKTPSGLIELFSERIAGFGYDDCPGHPVWLEPAEWLGGSLALRWPLHVLSTMPAPRLHAQLDAGRVSAAGEVQGREPLRISPVDAAARGIRDGDLVRVFNDRGALLAGALLTDGLMPGTVQLTNGAWYDPADPAVDGSLDKHGNANVLTLDRGTSRLGQATMANTALVEVERYEGDAPAVTAFDPPVRMRRSR
jgi:biotin/methionine sulfoxide reductase